MNSHPFSNDPADDERRRFYRKKFQATIGIDWGSATLTCSVRDIGACSLFVEMMPPLWLGAAFHARLLVNPVLELNCTVRRVEPTKGVAVSFELAEESGKAHLAALLASLPKV
jgi:hypothetical protein